MNLHQGFNGPMKNKRNCSKNGKWSQVVLEHAEMCNWQGFNKQKVSKDVIIFQIDDSRLGRKAIEDDIKGITKENIKQVSEQIQLKLDQIEDGTTGRAQQASQVKE